MFCSATKNIKYFSIVFIAISLLLFNSCNKEDDPIPSLCPDCNFTCLSDTDTDIITNDCDDNQTCSFIIHPDGKLTLPDRAAMDWEAGDKTVFLFNVYTDPNPDIADEESTTRIGFELPSDQASFSVDDSQLTDLNLHYQQLCFCAGIPIIKIESGCLQGKKQTDGSWWVQGDLTIQFDIDLFGEVKFEVKYTE